jgi:hypothetical protein
MRGSRGLDRLSKEFTGTETGPAIVRKGDRRGNYFDPPISEACRPAFQALPAIIPTTAPDRPLRGCEEIDLSDIAGNPSPRPSPRGSPEGEGERSA